MAAPKKKGRPISALAAWYGSNRTLAETVGEALKGCNHVAVLFAGGMCELRHIDARTLLVNDKHELIIRLARTVADPLLGPKLIRQLRRVPFHPLSLVDAQIVCKAFMRFAEHPDPKNHPSDSIEWARAYFITAWMGRNGKAGTKDEFSTGMSIRYDGGGGDSAVRFRSAVEALREWRKVLVRGTFTTDDVFDMLPKCKDIVGNGIYADAPWPEDGDLYLHQFPESDQRRLARELTAFEKARVVVRYGEHPLIEELYPKNVWRWNCSSSRTSANKEKREVLLVRN